jgi:hypothetical protein
MAKNDLKIALINVKNSGVLNLKKNNEKLLKL